MSIEIFEYVPEGTTPEERASKSKEFGDYFRDLSANYSTYQATGKWPARPEGLVLVEPLSDADLARAL